MQYRAHAHKQQGFIDDMNKSMGNSTIQRQFGANANGNNHEAKLVIQTKGQNAPQIIFDNGKEHWQGSHCRANPDQDIGSRKAARKRIDGKLGGKGG